MNSCFSKQLLKRATPFGVALFFVSSAGSAKVETYQDIIEKAYNLSLQKDRTQATNLLVSAAKKETKKGSPPKDLLAALEEVNNVFYSDKAQQLYELALSLRMTDPNLATQKLNEAARLEPENQQIALEQLRLQMAGGDCGSALKEAKKWAEKNPYSEEIKLVMAQTTLCSGQISEFQQLRAVVDVKKTGLEVFWMSLDLEHADRTGVFAKGYDLSQQFQKIDTNFPEFYYWRWKLEQDLKMPEATGKKYLAVCKSLSSRLARSYLAEPKLCRQTGEVEAALKKAGALGE